jgi:N6-L-threonylcarbamoyladenine synthase
VFLRFEGLPEQDLEFPFVGLLASGGHTALYRVDGPYNADISELGATRDDAAGEAFDKVAKLLGLGYPGGPINDRLAKEGNPDGVDLAQPMNQRKSLEFSFSGLKTNVSRWVTEHGRPGNDEKLRDLCATFQRRVVDSLMTKALAAAEREGIGQIVLAGGVAANRELRERGAQLAAARGIRLIVPPFRACTDNGGMIGYAGGWRLRRGDDDSGALEMSPRTSLPRLTTKGRGPRSNPS